MKTTTTIPDAELDVLASAVVDFALIAFEPAHYDGDPWSAASFAAFAWNTFDPRAEILSAACLMPDPRLQTLYRRLKKARRNGFARFDVEVWNLEAWPRPDGLHFDLAIGRPDEAEGRSCHVRVDPESVPDGVLPGRA